MSDKIEPAVQSFEETFTNKYKDEASKKAFEEAHTNLVKTIKQEGGSNKVITEVNALLHDETNKSDNLANLQIIGVTKDGALEAYSKDNSQINEITKDGTITPKDNISAQVWGKKDNGRVFIEDNSENTSENSKDSEKSNNDSNKVKTPVYTIRHGDTLWWIARDILREKQGTDGTKKEEDPSNKDILATVQAIGTYNHIDELDKIAVGTELRVPPEYLPEIKRRHGETYIAKDDKDQISTITRPDKTSTTVVSCDKDKNPTKIKETAADNTTVSFIKSEDKWVEEDPSKQGSPLPEGQKWDSIEISDTGVVTKKFSTPDKIEISDIAYPNGTHHWTKGSEQTVTTSGTTYKTSDGKVWSQTEPKPENARQFDISVDNDKVTVEARPFIEKDEGDKHITHVIDSGNREFKFSYKNDDLVDVDGPEGHWQKNDSGQWVNQKTKKPYDGNIELSVNQETGVYSYKTDNEIASFELDGSKRVKDNTTNKIIRMTTRNGVKFTYTWDGEQLTSVKREESDGNKEFTFDAKTKKWLEVTGKDTTADLEEGANITVDPDTGEYTYEGEVDDQPNMRLVYSPDGKVTTTSIEAKK